MPDKPHRLLFTGGSGKAGKHMIPWLLDKGHRVVNVDLTPLDHPGVDNITADITDSGQMFDVLSSLANFDELELESVPKFDAVVHFAAVPRILLNPDNETFRVNAVGTYNVIEAAVKLGIKKIIFASSETTYGICFAQGERKPDYLPVDEDHPVVPEDSYAMSKVANEVTARSFQRRTGSDIYGIRINNVVEPHEYAQNFPSYMDD
ncbi:MAG: NAD(P)-dependent oxidoreductase, partial [Pseudomonadota bacterium]